MPSISTVVSHNMRNLPALLTGVKTDLTALTTAVNELIADHATYKTIVDELKAVVNAQLSADIGTSGCKTAPVLSATAAGVTLASTAFQYTINGVDYYKAAADTAFTATAHDVATGSKWASYKISIATNGTITITISAANNYASEALAIAAVPATPAGECSMGYITVKSTAGAIWDATTDALKGGTGGTPAAETNFYPASVFTSYASVSGSSPATLTAGSVTMVTT